MKLPARLQAHPEFIGGEQAALMLRAQCPASYSDDQAAAWFAGVLATLWRMSPPELRESVEWTRPDRRVPAIAGCRSGLVPFFSLTVLGGD